MTLKCPNCGAENPEGQKFCGECGVSIDAPTLQRVGVLRCPNCGFSNPQGRRYCADCGSMIPRTPQVGAKARKRKKGNV